MVHSEHKQQLITLARRRAFETYLRFGGGGGDLGLGAIALDVVEDPTDDMGAVCNYDVKTGRDGLTLKRLREIAERLSHAYPGAIIYIIEVQPRL